MNDSNIVSVYAPLRWGLPASAIRELGQRLHIFWHRFCTDFKTKTRNTSQYACHYMEGQLLMEGRRNFSNIASHTKVSGQNMQHFMSNSPWSAQVVIRQVQNEIAATPSLEKDGMLILDESADKKSGTKSAGAGRQYNGRLGKVEMSQVGTFLAYANGSVWTWVDGELYLPREWFISEMVEMRKQLGIPSEKRFETKIELGWKMINRAKAKGFPFQAVSCDTLYGQSTWFRANLRAAEITYMAEVKGNTKVYLTQPKVEVPESNSRRGRKPTKPRAVSKEKTLKVCDLRHRKDTMWRRVRTRSTERGELEDEFAARRVWTIHDGVPVEEWLVIRREENGRCTYALSNAPADSSFERLAWLKCQRYFVERANQEAKSEMGWDELQAQKYLAWEHHLALTILATWFIAQTKLEWEKEYERDPTLMEQFEVEVLPALSVANVRTMLQAAMPLHKLTPEEAAKLVAKHLVRRTRSRKSRIRNKKKTHVKLPNVTLSS